MALILSALLITLWFNVYALFLCIHRTKMTRYSNNLVNLSLCFNYYRGANLA